MVCFQSAFCKPMKKVAWRTRECTKTRNTSGGRGLTDARAADPRRPQKTQVNSAMPRLKDEIRKTIGFELAKPNLKWVGEPIYKTIQNNTGWFFGSLDPTQKTTIPLVWLICKQGYLSCFFFLAHIAFSHLRKTLIAVFNAFSTKFYTTTNKR